MDPHVSEYIPKIVDIGNVVIDTEDSKEVMLKNVIDTPFSFEISPIKSNPDIRIIPMRGTIQPMNNFTIRMILKPSKYGIFRGEYELKLSEVNFTPQQFSVYGTCHDFKNPLPMADYRGIREYKDNKNILEKIRQRVLVYQVRFFFILY